MKIRNARGRKDENSGYIRLFDNVSLGQLISKVQATVISNGTELERLILARTNTIANLDEFINSVTEGETNDGIYVCKKSVIKKSAINITKHEPDLLIFLVQKRRVCKIIELKDGDAFDTKKSRGEKEQLEEFADKFGAKIPFVTEYYICCFNQNDKDIIEKGFKGVFDKNHILTGRELCDILKIDYDEIVNIRKADTKDNINYFLDEIVAIPEIKAEIEKRIK